MAGRAINFQLTVHTLKLVSVANSLQLMKTMFKLSTTTNYACSSPKVWPAARQLYQVENLDPCHFS